jgi:DegV family protein with EDD domain
MNINLEKLFYAMHYGANEVIINKNELNAINVFPVKDGDTGNNLASLMQSLIYETDYLSNPKDSFELIADTALAGARGNSGIIFAQYLNGLSMKITKEDEITLNEFSDASVFAAEYVFNSIDNPVEGTMITLMRELGNALSIHKDKSNKHTIFSEVKEHIKDALANTMNQLDVLKENNVVDSGAKGFVIFINGVIDYILSEGNLKKRKASENVSLSIEHDHHIHENIHYKYCTEFLVKPEKDISTLKIELSEYGDSLVVAGSNRLIRTHIHTNNPERAYQKVSNYGHIINQKVDNMKIQNSIVSNRLSDIAIVTDSIADLQQEFIEENQIHVLALNILHEDNTYLDRLTVSNEQILDLAEKSEHLPTSSLPSIKQVTRLLDYLKQNYKKVIILTVSKELSGTNKLMASLSNDYSDDDFSVKVVDTKQNAGAQGLVVKLVSDLVNQGTPFDEIVSEAKNYANQSRILVAVKDIDVMVKSGRLTKGMGSVGKKLKMKPIVTLDEGKGALFGVAFSDSGLNKKLLKHLESVKEKEIIALNIVHIDNIKGANNMRDLIEKRLGLKVDYINSVSGIVAAGAGRGAVALSYVTKQ